MRSLILIFLGSPDNYGPEYILDKEVILVTLNYRLGAFGFLSLENQLLPGNLGFRDQNVAMQWVQKNIQSFGGNPNDVTLFGESSGSFSVFYHIVSPMSAGLFHKAIAQSGAPFEPEIHAKDPGRQRALAEGLARAVGCSISSDNELISCLSEKPTDELLLANFLCQPGYTCSTNPLDATVDGYLEHQAFLPDYPESLVRQGLFNRVPMMVGVNAEEGIYSVAPAMKDPSRFSQVNEYWDYFGPLNIFDTDNATAEQIEISRLIKDFYMQSNPASMDTVHDVIDLFSDIVFWSGSHRSVMLQRLNQQ